MFDSNGRKINYMRISVTDKCNLRCRYCMPEGVKIVPMSTLLTIEEITAIVRQAVKLGIDRVKITGGEPLVRKGVMELISQLRKIDGLEQITMTTNGILLKDALPELVKNHIDGINISLDTTDPVQYKKITGFDKLRDVLEGIDLAVEAGIRVKINAVLLEDVNAGEWQQLIRLAKDRPVDVRFIELMPIGEGACLKGVSNQSLLQHIRETYKHMLPDLSVHGNGPAGYYKIPGYMGSVGFISALHHKFCSSCNRIRLSAMGELKPCLCYSDCVDLKTILRSAGEDAVLDAMHDCIFSKPAEHCFDDRRHITEIRKMSAIGG